MSEGCEAGASAAWDAPEHARIGVHAGARLGRYRLLRRIGAGGMGAVWEAEQDEPRRTVALKLLARGGDPEASARFRFEAEVLAQLSHPGIAQVYESGIARVGSAELPWFAMEHVGGARTLLEHAEERGLDLRERLRLFVRVADAVHHGHLKGVIHRDLKPANLLVDRDGHPKVIDFGIARFQDEQGPQRDLRTSTGQVLGTLLYMSPEQVSGRRGGVDLRSDVFALGLLLFELASGRRAYALEGLPLTEAVDAVSQAHVPSLRSLRPGLPRELDWIVQRACALERERRYPSVSELAADVERLLRGEPPQAAPPDTLYRLGSFVRRNRLAVGAGTVVVLALSVTSLVLARSLRVEKRALAAERAALESERVERLRAQGNADFLSEMLTAVSPERDGHDVRVLDVLDRAAPRLPVRFADQPLLEADLHFALANAYRNLSLSEQAVDQARAALALRERHLGPEHPASISALASLALCLRGAGLLDEAEPLLRQALERERALHGGEPRVRVLEAGLVSLLLDQGLEAEARAQLDAALAGSGPDELVLDEGTLALVEGELRLAVETGRIDEAEAWIDRLARSSPDLSPELARRVEDAMQVRSVAQMQAGDLDGAERTLRVSLERAVPIFGPRSQQAVALRTNLANVALLRGDGARALELLDEAVADARAGPGPEHHVTFAARYARCGALWTAGEKQRAIEELTALIAQARPLRPAGDTALAEWAGSLGRMHVATGTPKLGVPFLEQAFDVLAATRGERDPNAQLSLEWLVRALEESGEPERAAERRARLLPH